MDAGVLATVLLIAGLFLIALELMIPSFGIIGIAAGICLVISLWSAGQAWWGTSPGFFWTYTTVLVLGIPGVTGGVLFALQTTPLGKRVILKGQSKESLVPLTKVRNELSDLIGKQGSTTSLLTPGGMVEVLGRRYHAESVGMMVEADTAVVVVSVRGTRIVVRPANAADLLTSKESDEKSSSDSEVPAFLPEQVMMDGQDGDFDAKKADDVTGGSPDQKKNKQFDETLAKSEESGEGILDFQIPE